MGRCFGYELTSDVSFLSISEINAAYSFATISARRISKTEKIVCLHKVFDDFVDGG